MSNLQTVYDIYGAFAQGDVPGVLAKYADAIDWEYGKTSTNVPWLQHQMGKTGAATVMTASMTDIEIQKFSPNTFLETGNVVVVLIDIEFTVKATGKQVTEEDGVHIWRFDDNGKVIRFRHRIDTHQQQLACQP